MPHFARLCSLACNFNVHGGVCELLTDVTARKNASCFIANVELSELQAEERLLLLLQ